MRAATQSHLDHGAQATTLSAALIESPAAAPARAADGDYWVRCPACGHPAALRLADTVLSESPRCLYGCSLDEVRQALDPRLGPLTRESPSSLVTRESPSAVPLSESDGLSLAAVEIARLGSDPDAVRAMMATRGVTEPFENFGCVLTSHRGSACLFPDDMTGAFKYACRCEHAAPLMCTLADLRHAIAAQTDPQRLTGMELLPWFLRFAHEAGCVPAVLPALPAMASLSPRHRPVADGFALHVGLRRLVHPDTPVAFNRDFAALWCGVSVYRARAAIEAMRDVGVIGVAGSTGGGPARLPTLLYRPGDEACLDGPHSGARPAA